MFALGARHTARHIASCHRSFDGLRPLLRRRTNRLRPARYRPRDLCLSADLFIIPERRNAGLGRWLIEAILADPSLPDLRRWLLLKKDAKNLYLRCGFTELSAEPRYLERFDPNLYA
jgi:GNAT superfamily N-acetyltransferase